MMRVLAATAELARAATFAARHAAVRPVTPVLAGIRMTVTSDAVTVTGYDYEASSVATVAADVAETGEVLLPGRMAAEILRVLADDEISVTVKDSGVHLETTDSQFTLPCLPLEDYPAVPGAAPLVGNVEAKELGAAVAAVTRVALRDETVPLLAGIAIDVTPGRLSFTTTDRYRIAVQHLGWQPMADIEPVSAVVPARLFADSVKGLGTSGRLGLGLTTGQERRLSLTGETASSTIRLLDGRYPDVLGKMPRTFAGRVVVERDGLVAAVRRMALVADQYAAVVLDIRPDGLVVSASSDEDTRGRTQLPGTHTGEPETISMNVRYLLDGMACVDGPYAMLSYQHGVRPLLVEGCANADGTGVHPTAVYYAMPRALPTGP